MSPVAYWRLGETSGTSAADSAGSTTGTYAGGFTLGVAGLLTGDTNRAVQLNGTTGQVTLPNAAALNPTSAISIAGWLNSTSFTNRNPRIFQKGINDTQYRLLVEGGQLVFQIAGVGTVTGPLPSLNTRHFVVGTYDRTTMRLYLDGTQVGQTAATAAIPVTSEPAAIGNKPTSTDAARSVPGRPRRRLDPQRRAVGGPGGTAVDDRRRPAPAAEIEHAARAGHRHAGCERHVEGRRHDLVHGPRDRCRGRHPRGVPA